mmetsp:Transcript_6692/g.7352  ORF Transcript_6692/g.7352 Transcript_6692/m.7352 type:complete len:87 (+) Transcript_6692:96-356(+)
MKIILNAIMLSALFFSSGRAHNNKDLMEEMLNEVEKIEMKLNEIKDEDSCIWTGCSRPGVGCYYGYHAVDYKFCNPGWMTFCCPDL